MRLSFEASEAIHYHAIVIHVWSFSLSVLESSRLSTVAHSGLCVPYPQACSYNWGLCSAAHCSFCLAARTSHAAVVWMLCICQLMQWASWLMFPSIVETSSTLPAGWYTLPCSALFCLSHLLACMLSHGKLIRYSPNGVRDKPSFLIGTVGWEIMLRTQ